MLRTSLSVAFAVAFAIPAAAHAQTAMSPADQARTVCAPKRDKVGNKIGGEICMTGAQWQKALAKVRTPAAYSRVSKSSRRDAGHLAYPTYFRANFWGPSAGNRW